MSLFDSPEKTTESNSTSPTPSGDVLLKWGHRKRSRASRAAIEDSSSSVHIHTNKKNMMKVLPSNLSASASMPPPPPLGGRKDYSPPPNRSCLDTSNRKMASSGSTKCEKPNGVSTTTQVSERVNSNHNKDSSGLMECENEGKDKVSVEAIEWPRIYITLSRKEKEDDFLAMKGTKIPQRPKKRAKNIDRALQYCFPGMWLSDVTKSRYEIREKKNKNKSVKKQKRRGLKGMESLESGSE